MELELGPVQELVLEHLPKNQATAEEWHYQADLRCSSSLELKQLLAVAAASMLAAVAHTAVVLVPMTLPTLPSL